MLMLTMMVTMARVMREGGTEDYVAVEMQIHKRGVRSSKRGH